MTFFYASGFMGWDTGREDYVGVVEALLAAGADATVANAQPHYLTTNRYASDRIAMLLINAARGHRRMPWQVAYFRY